MMSAEKRSKLNRERLRLCQSDFAEKVAELLVLAEKAPGIPALLIADSYRPPEEQRVAYETGRSELLFGFHNTTIGEMPAALAVDLVDADEAPYSEDPRLYAWLAITARKLGLRTGVLFGLAQNVRGARQALINARNELGLAAMLEKKRGWDPLHVEAGEGLLEQVRSSFLRLPPPTY